MGHQIDPLATWGNSQYQTPPFGDLLDGRKGENSSSTSPKTKTSTWSLMGKLETLLNHLEAKRRSSEAQAAPQPLEKANFTLFGGLMLSFAQIYEALGREKERESIIHLWIEKSKERTNLSALHQLAFMLEEQGQYAEAERIEESQILPWLSSHPKMGSGSPQEMGSRKLLVRLKWKQGKREEARELMLQTFDLIDKNEGGEYQVYQEEERASLQQTIDGLESQDKVK